MIIKKNGVTLDRPDGEYYVWVAAGWTVVSVGTNIPVKPPALIDDSDTLDTLAPSPAVAWSAEHNRAQIFALLSTSAFKAAIGAGGSGGGVRMALDADGVYYPAGSGTYTIVQDADGVYYPKGA